MNSTEYSKLVDKHTAEWRKNPEGFQRGIDRFALLGIIVLVAAFMVAIGLILLLYAWTVIVGLVILYSIGRAIFYKPDPIAGYALKRADAPLLFDDVDQITRKLGARKCDGIYIDFDLNAYAVQFHRWGIVGPIRNYVLLGMPLMDAMGREHVRSTLAHEVGHLMLKHGAKSQRWYAMSSMYFAIRNNLRDGLVWYLFGPFANWYLPRFHARLQPVSLRSEFEADALEAKVTSKETAADALCYLYVSPSIVDKALREAFVQDAGSTPVASDLVDRVYTALRSWTRDHAEKELTEALQAITDVEGTHPALGERIGALGAEPRVPEPVSVCASDEYFGEKRRDFAIIAASEFLNGEYADYLKSTTARCKETETALEAKFSEGVATQEEAEEFVQAKGFLHGSADAKPLAEAAAGRFPKSISLQYFRAVALLREGDDAGIEALQMVARQGDVYASSVYEMIYQHFLRKGMAEEAAEFRRHRDALDDAVRETYDRRLKIEKEQEYEPANFTTEEIAAICRVLAQMKGVGTAYLAKRKGHVGPLTMYDLAVFPRKHRIVVDGDSLRSNIEASLGEVDRVITVFFGPWLEKGVRARLFATEGALIYDRDAMEP